MTKIPVEIVDKWCMADWKVQALVEAGGFECKSWFWNGPAIQRISFTSPDGELPRKLLDGFICECCEGWCVDFAFHIPTWVDFNEHDDMDDADEDATFAAHKAILAVLDTDTEDEDDCVDCACEDCDGGDDEDGDNCLAYFVAWGTHSEGNLLEANITDGTLTVVFWTTGFPADHWAHSLAEMFPEVEVDYAYRTFSGHTGSFRSLNGEILDEVHEVVSPVTTVSF